MTRLLLTRHGDDDLVAFGPEGARTKKQLLEDVAKVAAILPASDPGSRAGSRVLLVVQGDRYYCAVALLSALSRGHIALLPPNNQRDTVMALIEHPDTVTILHDTSVGAPVRLDHLLADDSNSEFSSTKGLAAPIGQVPSQGFVYFDNGANDNKTNDSQSEPKSGPKVGKPVARRSLESLLEEAEKLTAELKLTQNGPVVATCATTNAYGLVLSVLAPLLQGGAFLRTMHPSPQALRDALLEVNTTDTKQFTSPCGYLVGTPRHLNAMATSPGSLPCSPILCSPPQLTERQLGKIASHSKHPVTEIVTDQAVAAIGHRASSTRQSQGECFRVIPGMTMTEGNHSYTTITVPYLNAGAPTRCNIVTRLPAHVEQDTISSFIFLGRSERLFFQEAAILSLDEFERELRAHPAVSDAAAVTAPDPHNGRARILVAVATESSQLASVERQLAAIVAPFGLTHDLLCVSKVPISADGSCPPADVLRLFGLGKQGLPPNYDLHWQDLPSMEGDGEGDGKGDVKGEADSKLARFLVHVPQDCAYFEGHFPGYPILPAAAQLTAIILPAIQKVRPDLGPVRRLIRLKFLGRIRRADDVTVELRYRAKASAIDFSLSRKGNICSVGRVELQPHNLS